MADTAEDRFAEWGRMGRHPAFMRVAELYRAGASFDEVADAYEEAAKLESEWLKGMIDGHL